MVRRRWSVYAVDEASAGYSQTSPRLLMGTASLTCMTKTNMIVQGFKIITHMLLLRITNLENHDIDIQLVKNVGSTLQCARQDRLWLD